MVCLHKTKGLDRRHWLIYPALLCFATTGAVAAFSQDSTEVAFAADVPDATIESRPAPVKPPPATPEELGDAFMLHQRYQAAIESYRRATPTSDMWNKMGIAYQMMNASEAAAHCYSESLKLNPRNAHTLNNLGSLHFSLRDFGAAEHSYRKALKLEPLSTVVQLNLGTDLIAEHKYNEGWQHYQAAIDTDPHAFENAANIRIGNQATAQNRGAVNYYIARGLVRAGEMATAIDHLRLAVNQGFADFRKIEADQNFAALHGNAAYQDLISQPRPR